MRRLILCTIAALAVWLAVPLQASAKAPWAEGGPSQGEDLEIALLTFGVGSDVDIPSWFGHTALLVRDNRLRHERVYNYGMFSFGPGMLVKFLMGRLEFWVADGHAQSTIDYYVSQDRDVLRSELNLTPEKRREVAAFLAWNVEPENRDYLYDHYGDNCATRIRDIIDEATGGQFKEAASDEARFTLRDHTHRHTQRNPFIDVLLSAWMNDDIDEPIMEWDEMFLPGELYDQVEALEYVNASGETVPLVKETEIIHDSTRPGPPDKPALLWPWALLLGLILGGLGFWFARQYETTDRARWRRLLGLQHLFVGILFGIPGLVAALFHFTDHTITYMNENILLWNPLTFFALVLWFPIARGKEYAYRVMRVCWYLLVASSFLLLLLKPLPMFDQSNWFAIAMLLPFNVLMAAAMHRFGPPGERGPIERVADRIWSVQSTRRFMDLELGSRMTVVKLDDGSLWLHSPIALDDELKREVEALGEVKYLVGPNKYHHMHLGEWAEAFPDAQLCGAPGLIDKRDDLDFDVELGSDDEPWGEELQPHVVKGAPLLGEVVYFHPATKTLICADTAINKGSSDHLPTRIYLKLNRIENRFALSAVVKATFTDKERAKESIEEILEWDFERITMCHGSIADERVKEKFRESYGFLD